MYEEVLENHMWRVYRASQIYPLTPLYGSNWGHKVADIVAFTALEWNSYKESLDSWSHLPPDPLL